MDLTFLTPLAALVGLVALVPLAAAFLRERRAAVLRRTLGLAAPPPLARLGAAVALLALVGLLAVAAAQPAVRERRAAPLRTDAQAYVVLDISRSMLASAGPGRPTRFARAKAFADRLRAALPELPTGVATLTDRLLPNLFPSSDAVDFRQVVSRALTIDSPPPVRDRARSTDFAGLVELTTQNYFARRARRRVAVLLTDGESNPVDERWLAHWLRSAHVAVVVVRFWHGDERVYDANGRAEPGYRPDPGSAATADGLARAGGSGRAIDGGDVAGAAAAVRRLVGSGPTARADAQARVTPLSSYAVAAAAVPLAFLLFGRDRRGLALRLRLPARSQKRRELERRDA